MLLIMWIFFSSAARFVYSLNSLNIACFLSFVRIYSPLHLSRAHLIFVYYTYLFNVLSLTLLSAPPLLVFKRTSTRLNGKQVEKMCKEQITVCYCWYRLCCYICSFLYSIDDIVSKWHFQFSFDLKNEKKSALPN